MKKLKIAIIGGGQQAIEDHIPAVLRACDKFTLIGVVEKDLSKKPSILSKFKTSFFTDINELLKENPPDVALLSLPHSEYRQIIPELAKRKIHIIKEKPFAISMEEALFYEKLVEKHNITIQTVSQRRFSSIYLSLQDFVKKIDIFAINIKYTLNIKDLSKGWRAKKSISGGGAIIDMGYHMIDLINWTFGCPSEISAILGFNNKPNQNYDVEDTAFINFKINQHSKTPILGNLILSRCFHKKEECIEIIGKNGTIILENKEIIIKDTDDNILHTEKQNDTNTILDNQLLFFYKNIKSNTQPELKDQFNNIKFIEECYKNEKISN